MINRCTNQGSALRSPIGNTANQHFFYEPMSCRIAPRIQPAKQNKDLTTRKKVVGLGAIAFSNFTTQIVIFQSARISILRTAIGRKTLRAAQICPQIKKLFFLPNGGFHRGCLETPYFIPRPSYT